MIEALSGILGAILGQIPGLVKLSAGYKEGRNELAGALLLVYWEIRFNLALLRYAISTDESPLPDPMMRSAWVDSRALLRKKLGADPLLGALNKAYEVVSTRAGSTLGTSEFITSWTRDLVAYDAKLVAALKMIDNYLFAHNLRSLEIEAWDPDDLDGFCVGEEQLIADVIDRQGDLRSGAKQAMERIRSEWSDGTLVRVLLKDERKGFDLPFFSFIGPIAEQDPVRLIAVEVRVNVFQVKLDIPLTLLVGVATDGRLLLLDVVHETTAMAADWTARTYVERAAERLFRCQQRASS